MLVVFRHQALRCADPAASRPRVVVIGNFDGVHLGHQELFAQARRLAVKLGSGAEVAVLTFWPHPARVLAPKLAPPLILGRQRKRERLAECGIDVLVEQPFDLEFAAHTPKEFVDEVLVRSLGARWVVVGHDFTFGKGRQGTPEILRELLAQHEAALCLVPAYSVFDRESDENILCSSTFVRRAVQAGRLERAALVLGRDFELEGEVVHGAARGRTIGVHTANLRCDADLRPAVGIYAGWGEILAENGPGTGPGTGPSTETDRGEGELVSRQVNERHPAAISVGYNATFIEGDPALAPLSIEAHLIQPDGAAPLPWFYGKTLRLAMRARLRDELRFSSVDTLMAQIKTDIAACKALLEVHS